MALEDIGLFPIAIDIYKKRVGGAIQAHEGDAGGRGLLVTLTNEGKVFDATGIDLRLGFKDANGIEKLYDFEPVTPLLGKFKINYPQELLLDRGGKVFPIEVKAYENGTDSIINYAPLYVYVNKAIVLERNLFNTQEGSTLTKMIDEVQVLNQGLTNIETTENERKSAETLRGTTEANRVIAENGRVVAENTRATFYTGYRDSLDLLQGSKANAADVYNKTETYKKSEVNASLSALTTDVNAQLADIENNLVEHKLDYVKYLESELGEEHIIRSLPNGTKDEVRVSGGKAEKVQRVSDELVLNGAENWVLDSINNADLIFSLPNTNIFSKDGIVLRSENGQISFDTDLKTMLWDGSNVIYIKILSSNLSTQNAVGLKAWLQANPTTLTYQLATPILMTLPEQMTPNTIEIARLSELTNKLTNAIISLGGTIV